MNDSNGNLQADGNQMEAAKQTKKVDAIQNNEHPGAVADGLRAVVYSALQAPLNGLVQLGDHIAHTNLLPHVQFIDPCKPAELGSWNWHAQQLGGAAGMAVDFILARRLGGSFCGLAPSAAAETAALSNAGISGNILRSVATNGLVGFSYDTLCSEVKTDEGNFWSARFKHGLTGAATFSVLGGVSESLAVRNIYQPVCGALAGVPAGITHANVASLLTGKGFASSKDMAVHAYSFVFAGGAIGTIHGALDHFGDSGAASKTAIDAGKTADGTKGWVCDAEGLHYNFTKPTPEEMEANHQIRVATIQRLRKLPSVNGVGLRVGNQGEHNTCNVTAMEERMVTRSNQIRRNQILKDFARIRLSQSDAAEVTGSTANNGAAGVAGGKVIQVDKEAIPVTGDKVTSTEGETRSPMVGYDEHFIQVRTLARQIADYDRSTLLLSCHPVYTWHFADNIKDPKLQTDSKGNISLNLPRGASNDLMTEALFAVSYTKLLFGAPSKMTLRDAAEPSTLPNEPGFMTDEAFQGARAYVRGEKGQFNTFSDALTERFGPVSAQDRLLLNEMINSDSTFSVWTRNIGPMIDGLISLISKL